MKYKIIFLLLFFILIFPVTSQAYETSKVGLNSSWKYADFSNIHTGEAVLYKADSNSNGHTVAINAGHGTSGGTKESLKTYSHPDKTGKVTGGTNKKGEVKSYAVSTGMDFKDGTSEASVNLRMAQITRDILLENGFNVLMIRDGADVQLDNIARTVISNNNADIHLAIHWNGNDAAKGPEGIFFMSIPDNTSYKNMEPVKSHWQEHNELGRKIISVMKADGIGLYGNGEMEMDLTQTSYSTIPSIDIEFGNQFSKHDDATLTTLANAFAHGISEYFNTTFKPSKGGSGSSNMVSSSSLNLSEFSLTSEDKTILEEAMKSWPSEIDAGRIEVLKKGLSLINIGIHYPSTKHPAADKCKVGHYDREQPKSGDGMDCSDYVAWAFHAGGASDVDTELCTNNFAASPLFTTINESDLLPGDIALYKTGDGCTSTSSGSGNHIGIYFGKASGQNIFIHSTSGSSVTGPQVKKGTGSFKIFRRYNNFSSIESSSGSSSSGGSSGYVQPGLQNDEYSGNGFQEIGTREITCETVFMGDDGELNELGEFVNGFFLFIKLATPVLVIILSTIDYIKAITNPDDSEMKKVTQKIAKRVLFGFLIFLLPFLLDLLFHLFGLYELSACGIGTAG